MKAPHSNKIALITGASRGIGKAIALRFAQEGIDLILSARNHQDLLTVQSEVEAMGRQCFVMQADLRNPETIQNLVEYGLDAMGAIDILVNNAGVGYWKSVEELTLEQFDEMFEVNVRAVFLLTKAVLPHMKSRGNGHIINIASTSSRWTYPQGTLYCASKFAVLGFNEALAKELRPDGIRVTAICPGQVNTYLGGGGPEDWEADMLDGKDVADLAVQAISMPPHAIVTEIVVWPRAEAF